MPGSIVTAPALENSTSSDQTHLSGLCGIFGADGLDSKVAASLAVSTREAPVNVVAHTGENGNSESPNDGSMAEAHKDENGHAESCREHAKAVSETNTHTVEAAVEQKPSKAPDGDDASCLPADSTQRSNGDASRDRWPHDDKGVTPETTSTGSECMRAGAGPSPPGPSSVCVSPSRASESAHLTAGGSPESISAALSPQRHVHISTGVSSCRTEKLADETAVHNFGASQAQELAVTSTEKIPEAQEKHPTADGMKSLIPAAPGSRKEKDNAQPCCGAEKETWNPAMSAATTKCTTDDVARGDDLVSDQQLVESLIAAAACNVYENGGDSEIGGGGEAQGRGDFALSDTGESSSRKAAEELSAEDKTPLGLAAAKNATAQNLAQEFSAQNLLQLAGNVRQIAEDAEDEDDGEDDDDAASSSRQGAGSDGDDMDDDSKTAKDTKGVKVPGKRGPKKKKTTSDATADSKAEGPDNEEDGDDDGESGKSARKSKDTDGDETKKRGRKGKNQNGTVSDRNLSREEKKMQAYMRQFALLEQKEKAKTEPCTPRPQGKAGEDTCAETQGPASQKKRKEAEEDDANSSRKKPKSTDEDKQPTDSPRGTDKDIAAEAKPTPASKARGRPPHQKLTGKQKIGAEKEATGTLVALRSYKASHDAPRAVRPRREPEVKLADATFPIPGQTEYNVVQKCLRFAGKKSYTWIEAQLAHLAEHVPHTAGAPDWLSASRKARLNPGRRMIDKKRFPAIKSCLAKWTYESHMQEKAAAFSAISSKESDSTIALDVTHLKTEDPREPASPDDIPEVEMAMGGKDDGTQDFASNAIKQESCADFVKIEGAASIKQENPQEDVKAERGGEDSKGSASKGSSASASAPSSKAEIRIPRKEHQHADTDKHEADRKKNEHGSNTSMERSRFGDAPAVGGQRVMGYGSLAITIPVGGSQHASQYGWDQRVRNSDTTSLVKNGPGGQDLAGTPDQRWQRGAESPAMWGSKREGTGPPATSLSGPSSPSKIGNSALSSSSWDRSIGRDRSEARSSKSDADQDARWQRSKDISPGHVLGKRDSAPPRDGGPPSPTRDSTGNWARSSREGSGRTSAWDQPPSQGETQGEGGGLSRDASMADRDMDRSSSAIRNLADISHDLRRDSSPLPLRRRVSTPPRGIYEMRDRGMDVSVGPVGGAGGGGLSRESLRREREDALLRDREPAERDPPPRFMRSEIVRSEIRSSAPERANDSPRSRGMLNQWDVGPRARSPRPLDRPIERPPLERPGMGRAMSPPPGIRDRSLSPRSKELQREMQAARERRVDRVDRKDEWGRDIPESRRDGSESSPGPEERDLPLRQLGGPSGAGRGGWWGGSSGRGRGSSVPPPSQQAAGLVRRQRPSMFAARRPREDGYSNSPPRNR